MINLKPYLAMKDSGIGEYSEERISFITSTFDQTLERKNFSRSLQHVELCLVVLQM